MGRLRQVQPSLSQSVVVSCLMGVLGACLVAGFHSHSILTKNRIMDNWAIMFLESENSGYRLRDYLDKEAQDRTTVPDLELSWSAATNDFTGKSGGKSFRVTMKQLGLDSASDIGSLKASDSKVLLINGVTYLVSRGAAGVGTPLQLKKITSTAMGAILGRPDRKARTVYVITKQGRLVYSTDAAINNENFISRELVKKFVQSSLSGQIIEFNGKNDRRYYGSVHEVSGTNVVVFSEVSRELLIGNLTQIIQQYALLVLLLITAAVLIISFPIARVSRSMGALSRFARHIATGDYGSLIDVSDCMETAQLAESLNVMVQSIRDNTNAAIQEAEERLIRETRSTKKVLMNEVENILQVTSTKVSERMPQGGISYLGAENLPNAVRFEMTPPDASVQSLLISEVRADFAEVVVYQSAVATIVKNAIKNTFDDIKSIIRRIDEVPSLINQTSVESAQYFVSRSPRGSELFLKIWSRFGLSIYGLQASLTEDGKLDFDKAAIIDLGQKTLFEASISLKPREVLALICSSTSTPVVREAEKSSDDFISLAKQALKEMTIGPSFGLEKMSEEAASALSSEQKAPLSVFIIGLSQ